MARFTPPIIVKIFLLAIIYSFISCASEVYESNTNEALEHISTAVSVTQVIASGNENLSRGETKAPEMKTFKVEGAKGEMYMRYTAAAGIEGKDFTYSENNEDSRGKMITTADFYDDYGLFIYEYPITKTWAADYSAILPKVVNEQVLKGRKWKTNEFWPGAGAKLALYGYAPYNAAGVSALPTAATAGKPTFHYVTPTEAVDQKDLLVSEDDQYVTPTNINGGVDVPGNYNAIKTLKFKHACTAVRIAVGTQMAPCTIKKIAIKGVYGEADYNYGAGTNLNEGKWENYSSTLCNYTLTADFTVSATDQNKVINSGKYTFMLLPQIVPDNAVIEITLDDGEQHVLTANISGSDWKMGYSITYFLTTSSVNEEYILLLSSPDTQMLSEGGSNTLKIQSYRQTFYGSQVAVPWTLAYNYADDVLGTSSWHGTSGEVITSVTSFNGSGSITGETQTIQVARQVERSKPWRSTHTATLRSAAQQGSAGSPVDLSAGKQTANCYVVSAPGYYTFPLVYGNARNADGSANTDSYGTDTFVDHQGVKIDDPYIYLTNGGANIPANAFIVWQDAPHLITPSSVKLSSDKHSIEFQVEQKNICQGNSVIAVCDANGTIMWSWHIWVTDHDMDNTIEVHNNPSVGGSVISHFMEVPLGYCDAETRVRDKRTFTFKVTQAEAGGETSTLAFEQLSADSLYTYGNNAPYYQWGRKDPMLPSNGNGALDKVVYDAKFSLTLTFDSSNKKEDIMYPYMYNLYSGSRSLELWSKGNNSTSYNSNNIKKTIYSPIPYGFNLSPASAFSSFISSNITGGTSSGFYFNTLNNGSIYIHNFLYRDYSSGYINTASANYWTGAPAGSDNAWCMRYETYYDPSGQVTRNMAYGFNILLDRKN